MEEKGSFWGYLLMVGILIFIAHSLWKDHKERKASLAWPSTQGKIVRSYLKEVEHTSYDEKKSVFFQHSSYTEFEVVIKYEYKVDDRFYTGTRIRVTNDTYSRESEAAKILDGYKEGKDVNVFYNPLNPKNSVLTPG